MRVKFKNLWKSFPNTSYGPNGISNSLIPEIRVFYKGNRATRAERIIVCGFFIILLGFYFELTIKTK